MVWKLGLTPCFSLWVVWKGCFLAFALWSAALIFIESVACLWGKVVKAGLIFDLPLRSSLKGQPYFFVSISAGRFRRRVFFSSVLWVDLKRRIIFLFPFGSLKGACFCICPCGLRWKRVLFLGAYPFRLVLMASFCFFCGQPCCLLSIRTGAPLKGGTYFVLHTGEKVSYFFVFIPDCRFKEGFFVFVPVGLVWGGGVLFCVHLRGQPR